MNHPFRRPESDDSGGRLDQLSDEQLITEIVQGRHDALTVLFDRFGKLMFTIADRILHDPAESEEVVQTVLLDVCSTHPVWVFIQTGRSPSEVELSSAHSVPLT